LKEFIIFHSKSNVYDPTYTNIPDQCREIYQIYDIEDENIKTILKEAMLNLKEDRLCTVIFLLKKQKIHRIFIRKSMAG